MIIYLSKSAIYKQSSGQELHISQGKQKFCLTGIQSESGITGGLLLTT